jgi:hypothetical protein
MDGHAVMVAGRAPLEVSPLEPSLFRSTLERTQPAEIAYLLFMVWLGSSPAWMLLCALLAS